MSWWFSCSVMSNSLWHHGLWSTKLFCPQNFPSKNTGVGFHYFLQGIFPIQLSNQGLLHYRHIIYQLSHQGIYAYMCHMYIYISSVKFSHAVVSDSLRPHESQHARPPCPSPTPGVHSDSYPSSVVLFSSCPQSLPAPESFPVSQLFAWGSQSTTSALASVLQWTPRSDLL